MQRARSDQAKDARRRALLEAALDEFFERGFAAARMDDIARRAGVSKGALYLYFDSKDALFNALIESVAVPKVERVEMFAAQAPTARAALRSLMEFAPLIMRETALPRVAKGRIGDAGAFPDLVARYRRDVIERALAAIAGVLERGRDTGELIVDDPHLAARLVVAPLFLSAIWSVVFQTESEPGVDLEALFAMHERNLLRAFAVDNGGSS